MRTVSENVSEQIEPLSGRWRVAPTLEAFDHEASTVYVSPQEPSYVCWVVVWKDLDGACKVSFVEVVGDPTLTPTYDFNHPALECHNKTLLSADQGRTWRDTGWKELLRPLGLWSIGNSDHHWRSVVALPDGRLLRMMPAPVPGRREIEPDSKHMIYQPEMAESTAWPFRYEQPRPVSQKYPVVWESGDGGQTWQRVATVGERAWWTLEEGWSATDMLRLADGSLLLIGGTYAAGTLGYGSGDQLAVSESRDDGRTWSALQSLDLPADLCGDLGWGDENGLVEISGGRVLVISRVASPGGRRLARLVRAGNRWEVEAHWVSTLPYSGFPHVTKAGDGTLFYNGHEGVYGSTDEGATWTRLTSDTMYYPQLVEAAPGRIVSLGHVGIGDTAWPPDQESSINAASFSYREVEAMEQTDFQADPALALIRDSHCADFHLRAQVRVGERAGVAFRVQDEAERGCYVLLVRLKDGPSRWAEPRSFAPADTVLELIKLVDGVWSPVFKRHVGQCRPGAWVELQLQARGPQMMAAVLLPGGGLPQYLATQDDTFTEGRLGLFTHLSAATFKGVTIWDQPQTLRDNWLTQATSSSAGLIPPPLD